MKKLMTLICACLSFATAFSYANSDTIRDPTTNKNFPKFVTVEDNDSSYVLEATGILTRTKFFIKIYTVVHYLQNPVSGSQKSLFNQIFDDRNAKQLSFTWIYSVDAQRVQTTFLAAFQKNLSAEKQKALQHEIDQFLSYYSNGVNVNDTHNLRWLPGGLLEIEMNGELKGTFVNLEFAKAVWRFG